MGFPKLGIEESGTGLNVAGGAYLKGGRNRNTYSPVVQLIAGRRPLLPTRKFRNFALVAGVMLLPLNVYVMQLLLLLLASNVRLSLIHI